MPNISLVAVARLHGWSRARMLAAALVVALLASLTSIPTFGALPAAAAPGDAEPQLTSKTTFDTVVDPGDTISYSINFTCSNNEADEPADGCDGAVFEDPLPTYVDVYGDTVPVEFVSATGPAGVWPGGFALETSDPANPVVRATAGIWPAGTSGVIYITVRVPASTLPPGSQVIANQARVTDPEDATYEDTTPVAETTVEGSAPNWQISKVGPGEDLRPDRDYGWVVSVCTPDPNSALYPVYDITDTLPEGFEFISANHAGTFTDDATADGISDGTATVTWHFDADQRPPLGSDGCFRLTVTGRFPSSHPSNVEGATKTNTASGTGTGSSGPESIGEDDHGNELSGPQFGGASLTKGVSDLSGVDEYFVAVGDSARFDLSVTVDSDFPLDSLTVTDGSWQFTDGGPMTSGDGWPQSFTATSIDPGTWNDPVTATIETTTDGTTWAALASGVASGDPDVAVPGDVVAARWTWSAPGAITGDFAASGMRIIGTMGTPVGDFGRYTNTAALSVEPTGQPTVVVTDSDEYILEVPTPHPGVTKTVSDASRQPGQDTTFTIVVNNSPDATGDLVDPVVADCVPQYLDVSGSPALGAGWVDGPGTTCGPDEAPLSFQWIGTLEPGDSTPAISYVVEVRESGPPAPPGVYDNTATVLPAGGGSFGHCQNTNPTCGSTASVTVEPTIMLASAKCVRGELDGGVYRPSPACASGQPAVTSAQTRPGGIIEYRLQLQNTGNTDATNVTFVDILAHEGDTAVITGNPLNPRHSEFRPFLLTPIDVTPGWTVEYSTSANPCRPDVGGPSTGCDDPAWTSSPNPLALSTYRSIRMTFSSVLARGETGEFTWQMRAPVNHDHYDEGGSDAEDPYEFLGSGRCSPTALRTDPSHCPRAVNSFAYGADAANLPVGVPQPSRLYAEPTQVEVRVTERPSANAIGNRVWFDDDYDGIQDPGEPGISDVLVELYDAGTDELRGTTFTDENGEYLFSSIEVGGNRIPMPAGTYYVVFHPPAGYLVSPPDESGDPTDQGAPGGTPAGTNTDDDSDVPRTPVHRTVDVEVGNEINNLVGEGAPGETDLTWDLGLWAPEPQVEIDKVTGDTAWGDDAFGDGVLILPGRPVEWRYTITNSGNSRLEDVTVTDDGGPGADFAVTSCTIVDGGQNADGLVSSAVAPMALNRGAVVECTATGTAGSVAYANVGTVEGTPVADDGSDLPPTSPDGTPVPETVDGDDPSSYTPLRYDLALAKTVGTPNLATGEVTFTITVRNQGNVASGDYTVTDRMTEGLTVVSTSPAATTQSGSTATGTTLGWDLTGLSPSTNRTITINARIDDWSARPYRNWAEISSDGSGAVTTGDGVSTPTADVDSTPDADPDNDGDYGEIGEGLPIDNTGIGQAGVGADAPANGGEDDADIADLDPEIVYDLALAKVAVDDEIDLGETPVFTVRVYNQGNVPSLGYTVLDQLPTGLSYDAANSSAACTALVGDQVRCTGTSILPGSSATFTIATTIDGTPTDWSTAPWTNWAEIETDSADDYSTPTETVTDVDSTPESVEGNGVGQDVTPPGDDVIDVTTAGATYAGATVGDEDDNDLAVVTTSVVYDLALAKTAAATPPTQTDPATITYTITVQNQGTVDSGAFTMTDLVPPGLTVTDAGGGTAVVGGDGSTTVTFAGTNLLPGASTTFTVGVEETDLMLRPYRNVAEISADSGQLLYRLDDVDSTPDTDPTNDGAYGPIGSSPIDNLDIDDAGEGDDPSDDADIADVTFPLTYDLALAKVADADLISYDDTITYTVTVQNQGVLASHEFTVTDQVPPGLAVVAGSISHDGVLVGSTITWTIDDLAPAASLDLTFQAVVDDITLRPYRNWAEISSDSADDWSVPGEPVTDVDSTPDADPDNDGDYGEVGEGLPIDNTGTDAIDQAGVGADAPANGGEDDADIADVDVDVTYDLALVKTVSAPTISHDGTATFTIVVANQGNVPSGPFTVVDDVPAGLAASAASHAGVVAADGSTVTWTDLASLAPGATVSLTFDVTITDITQRPFTNVAEITEDSADDYSTATRTVTDVDSVPGDPGTSSVDNTDISEAGVGADAGFDDEDIAVLDSPVTYDLALVKTGPASMDPTGDATFTIVVANQGNVPSGAYTVVDTAPTGMVVVSTSAGGAIVSGGTAAEFTNMPSVAPGATATLTVTMRVSPMPDGLLARPYVNVAEITADSADGYSTPTETITDVDSVPGDPETSDVDNSDIAEAGVGDDVGFDDEDVALVTTTIVYDLALVKTVSPAAIHYDETATFTVRVVNQGNVPSGLFTVVDDLPAGLAASAVSHGGVLSADGSTITWTDLASLAPGASVALTFDVTITDLRLRPYVNVAEITADSADDYSTPTETVTDVDSVPGDPDTSDADNTDISEAGVGDDVGFDDEDVAVLDDPITYDLAIAKELLPGQSYALGSVIEYRVTVTNEGSVRSGLYSFTDTLPEGMEFVAASHAGTASGQVVTWADQPSLLPGEHQVVSISARLVDVTRPSYRNWVQITEDSADDYSTPSDPITDVDSTTGNGELGEDDDAAAEIDVAAVRAANATAGSLPRTGAMTSGIVRLALLLIGVGLVLAVGGRRRLANARVRDRGRRS